jgi:hypothetical protein
MSDFDTLGKNVCRAIGDLGQKRLLEVQAVVNMVYLNEVLNVDTMRPLFWLRYMDDSIFAKEADTITGISKANPGVITMAGDTFVTGDVVSLHDIVGMTQLNDRLVKLTRNSANNYGIYTLDGTAINSTNFTTYTSGGDVVHKGVTLSSSHAVKSIISFNWHGYSEPLEAINSGELEESTYWHDESQSRPKKFQHVKFFSATGTESDLLLWFAGADAAYHGRLWIEKSPPALSATTDVPYLPPQFHGAIEAGAITRLGENKVQVEAGVIWPQVYQAQLDAIKNFNRRLWEQYEEKRNGLYLL